MKKPLIGLTLVLTTFFASAANNISIEDSTCGKIINGERTSSMTKIPAPSIDFCLKILALEEFGHNNSIVRKSEKEDMGNLVKSKITTKVVKKRSLSGDVALTSLLADKFSDEFRGITVSEATTNPAFLMILDHHLNQQGQ